MGDKVIMLASDARTESAKSKEIADLRSQIIKEINQAVESGLFFCDIPFSVDTPNRIRQVIKQELIDRGYTVVMPMYGTEPPECPASQMHMYDQIRIEW